MEGSTKKAMNSTSGDAPTFSGSSSLPSAGKSEHTYSGKNEKIKKLKKLAKVDGSKEKCSSRLRPVKKVEVGGTAGAELIHLTTLELDGFDSDEDFSDLKSVQALLNDDSTSNLVENLKKAYDGIPRKNKGREISDGKNKTSCDEASIEEFTSTSSSEEMFDDENDEDYLPTEGRRKQTIVARRQKVCESNRSQEIELAETARRKKPTLSRNAKRLMRRKIETSFPPRFSDVVSESEWEEEPDFNWSALTGLDAKLTAEIGHKDLNEADATPDRRKLKTRGRLPDELGSLLGQANVSFAQNRIEEAMQMCHEVIRQRPNHSESYEILGSFHEKLGDMEKYLQFSLLSAHLDGNCSGEKWAFLAQLAVDHGKLEQACDAYSKAAVAEPTVWDYYKSRIALLSDLYKDFPETAHKRILETRLRAVRGMLKNKSLALDDYLTFARSVFQDTYKLKDLTGAILCLRCCLHRAYSDSVVLYPELNNFMELNMQQKNYDEALKAVFTFTLLKFASNKDDLVQMDHETSIAVGSFIMPRDFPVDILAKTVCCSIYTDRLDHVKPLLNYFECNHKSGSTVDLFLDIADALTHKFLYNGAESLLTSLIESEGLATAAVWLCYADTLSSQGRLQAACKAYSNVVELAPKHVTARLTLSALQQQLGLSEEAVKTLDFGESTDMSNLDERILCQKCVLLENQGDTRTYLQCAKQFLARFFKDAYNKSMFETLQDFPGSKLTGHLRSTFLAFVHCSQLERLIKRVPSVDVKNTEVQSKSVWDIFTKVYHMYDESKRYTEMVQICCYAYSCPMLVYCGIGYVDFIIGYLIYAALQGKHYNILLAVLKFHVKKPAQTKIHANLLGLALCAGSERLNGKWLLHQAILNPDNFYVSFLVGNYAMFGSLFQHSLAEFATVLPHMPDDPLINFVIGVSYINLSSKRDIVRRHDLCIQGLCFLSKYEKLRGPCQETYYNLGRAMHQIGLCYAAVHYYEKALQYGSAVKPQEDKYFSDLYDLSRIIAHNLVLIYCNSNNPELANFYLEKYCTI